MGLNTFTAILPLPPDDVSPNRASHQHWSHRHRATRAYRDQCWASFHARRPVGWKPCAVSIEVDYYACRKSKGYKPRDIQNALSALKAAIDGMIDAKIAPSDSRANVQWGGIRLHGTERELKRAPEHHHVTLEGCVVLTISAL